MSPQITCPRCGSTINLENRKEVDFKKIMYALNKSPKTFTELLAITNLPRKTLSLRLKDLCSSGSIVKDGGYHLNSSIKPTNRILGKRNGNGKMNRTMLHIGKNVQWIPVALIACLVVVAFGSAMMISPPAPHQAPAPPTASFFYVPSSNIVTGKTLTFDAALSTASNGPITDYYWDFGDGSPSAYGQAATHAYVAEGTYVITLTVRDAHGVTTSTQETLYVSPAPLPPTTPINFIITPDSNMTNSTGWENQWIVTKSLTFDASAFNASTGFTPNYSWNFGDGSTTRTGVIVSHVYTESGTYYVTLSVTDLQGYAQSIAQQVQILPMPAARIYVDSLPTAINQSQIGQTITLNIMISNVTDLYTWGAGMTFNPAVLECIDATTPGNSATNGTTALREGPFFQKGGNTLWVPAAITEDGVIPCHGCTLTGATTPGVSGSGVLATVEFIVIGAGASNIHLTNVMLLDSEGTAIPVFVAT